MATPRSAAIYLRISQDRSGEHLGVKRQEPACRDLADRLGWTVGDVYTDNDVKAHHGKPRPAYRRMLDDLTAGLRDGIIVLDQDRLVRHTRELEDLIDHANTHGYPIANVTGITNLATPEGRMIARIQGVMARHEGEQKSVRLKRQRAQAAAAGKPGGGKRAYGYARDGVTIVEEEAGILREAAARALAGEPVRAIARDFTARGVPTAQGGRWSDVSLRGMLRGPRWAGMRVHLGKVTADGAWPAVFDRVTHERLKVALAARPVGAPVQSLLGGIMLCGRCGYRLRHDLVSKDGRRWRTYRCGGTTADLACRGVSVVAEPVEAIVTDAALTWLAARPHTVAAPDVDLDALQAAVDAEDRKLVEWAEDLDAGRVDRVQFLAVNERIMRRREEAVRRLTVAVEPPPLAGVPFDLPALRVRWGGWSVAERRRAIGVAVESVVVGPGRSRLFDPGRVQLTMR